MDPVTWAAQTLDWHCLDPDGEIWKRKNPDEYYAWLNANPGQSIEGKSRYHRPYQATSIRCSSQFKVARWGRQTGKSEALCILILFNMVTKKNFKVVMLTPYQAQIEELFGRIEQLIREGGLGNSIKRNVKAPIYQIELYNGSRIRGFTAGTKSGGNADSVRGQPAEMLVFDEVDYLSVKDIESAMSVTNNYPLAQVWMSSTPTGKRDYFFRVCTENKQFKEFYYPASVNPMWTPEREEYLKSTMTSFGYNHEVLAIFGEQEEGVFQNVFIENAQRDYKYSEATRNPSWVYMMGVDWNDFKNGVSITVSALDPSHNQFRKVTSYLVQKQEYQQHEACVKIVELNRIWRPASIYVDRGYGTTNIEILHKYGWDCFRDKTKGPNHPDSKLKDIVKPYDFGSNIEITDPLTDRPVKKDAKPFLVENTVRRFERGDFIYSKHDDTLTKQLQAYIIDKISAQGKPVYKPNSETVGDHDLDSLMLSLIGFTLEGSLFSTKALPSPDIRFAGRLGEHTHKTIEEGRTSQSPPGLSRQKISNNSDQETKPTSGRIQYAENPAIFNRKELPAYNTGRENNTKLWRWPGFGHDAPKPKPKAYSGLKPKRFGRPGRTNI